MDDDDKQRGRFGLKYLAIAAIYVLSLCSLAPYLPFQSRLVDLPSHFALQYALGAFILLLAARYFRLPQGCYVLAAASLAINLVTIAPYLPYKSDAPVTGPTLKILQTNVLFLNHNTDALKKLIEDEQPDLIVAAEVNNNFAAMFKGLTDYPYASVWPDEHAARGLAVLSKTPLAGVNKAFFEDGKIPSQVFQLQLGGKAIEFVSVHPYTPLVNLQSRDALFTGLAATMQHLPPQNLVVLGDFNATPYSPALKKLTLDLQLHNAREGKGLFGTWPVFLPTPLLHLPIDQFLGSDTIAFSDYRTGPDIGSDHLPSIITLSFKAP